MPRGATKSCACRIPVLDLVGDDPEGEGKGRCPRLGACLTIGEDAGKLGDLGDPSAIFFAVELEVQVHGYG